MIIGRCRRNRSGECESAGRRLKMVLLIQETPHRGGSGGDEQQLASPPSGSQHPRAVEYAAGSASTCPGAVRKFSSSSSRAVPDEFFF